MRDLTRKQAKRFMNIAMEGKCRVPFKKIPDEKLNEFHKSGKLEVIRPFLPVAVLGIKKRTGLLSRLGLKRPEMDYFLKDHNVQKLEEYKKTGDMKSLDCLVRVGKVYLSFEGKTVVEFPDGKREIYNKEIKAPYVITHKREIVDNGTEKDYRRYLKSLK